MLKIMTCSPKILLLCFFLVEFLGHGPFFGSSRVSSIIS